jgi:hypothetical protein
MRYEAHYHDFLIYELEKNTNLTKQEVYKQIYLFSKTDNYKKGYENWLRMHYKPEYTYGQKTHIGKHYR